MGTTSSTPAVRRKRVLLASGTFIVAGLVMSVLPVLDPAVRARATDLLLVLAAVVAGTDIAHRAWQALRVRHVGIELLVTVATVGGLLIGEVWEAAAVTFLFALGGYLEARTLSGTRRAVERLLDAAPERAIVLRGDTQHEVAAHEVRSGDLVLVKPGSRVPVDGVVEHGHGAIDQSSITGESIPVEKGPGTQVFAGTISQGGLLRVRATGTGSDTTLARIIRRVEEAQEAKAPAQRTIERFAQWYTPLIMLLAVGAWLLTRDVHLALTLLVIGCPGALVISIPVALVAGIGRAARDGILIKGGEHIERLAGVTAVAFDKTGTLTEGTPRLTEVVPLAGDDGTGSICTEPQPGSAPRCAPAARDLLWQAAIAENGSEHPLGRPIVAAAGELGAVPQPDGFEAVTGRGVRARVDEATVEIGSVTALAEWGIPMVEPAAAAVERVTTDGGTALVVAVDSQVAGVIGVAGAPRDDARTVLRRLRDAGVERLLMLTGDHIAAARHVAGRVGISEVHAGLLPEEKLDLIRQLQAEGEIVAMVGDGVNDAPALAGADVGIAMGAAGSDVAIETADVALMTDDLTRIPRALELARRTMRAVRQNMAIALVTVAALLAGVLAGEVHMAGGMLVHELSVLAVIANGMRLMRA